MADTKWTKGDKAKVRLFLSSVAAHVDGGQAGIARELGIEGKSARATVNAWARRGRVPFEYVPRLLELAPPELVGYDATHLCPEARVLAPAMPGAAQAGAR